MEIISPLYPFFLDWLDLVVRWIHIVVGIAFGFLIGILTFNIYQFYLNQKNTK